jgi:hypothetical protein
MNGTGFLWVAVASVLLIRNGFVAARILLRREGSRLRAVVPLLTCLLALAVLVMAARGALLAAHHPPGGPP